MNRALAVLTAGALLTLIVEMTGTRPDVASTVTTIVAGVAFAVLVTAGFAWVDRRTGRRRTVAAWVYAAVAPPLGFLMFAAADAGIGATLLMMVLVSQCVRLLPAPGWIAVTALVPFVHLGMEWGPGLRNGLGTLAAAAFTAVVTWLLLREQRAGVALAEANGALRGYAAQAEELATTRERNRVARDIHDGLGHHLTVVAMQVQAARAILAGDPERADAVLAQAQEQAGAALAEVRRSVAALREPRETPPLPDALAELVADSSASGVATSLEIRGEQRLLAAPATESVFRTAQEGLTNVRKHAGAATARLVLDYRDTGCVRLEVHDDGCGTPPPEAGGFGLLGLRERAGRLGGRLDVDAVPGRGTTLTVEVPG